MKLITIKGRNSYCFLKLLMECNKEEKKRWPVYFYHNVNVEDKGVCTKSLWMSKHGQYGGNRVRKLVGFVLREQEIAISVVYVA